MRNRALVLSALASCAAGIVLSPSARASRPPFTVAAAERPFVAAGYKVGCPNLFEPAPPGIPLSVGIAVGGAATACEPNLGRLSVYRTAAKAEEAFGASAKYFFPPRTYRVRNVVLTIDLGDSAVTRNRLLAALRKLGNWTRVV
jgi:hypothetical protein